jgi:para-nitrobenzyl esterase
MNRQSFQGVPTQAVVLLVSQANIEAFGGNRSQVLLFGQSAGAFSGWIHLALPSSKGLFTSLMLDSGAGTPLNTLNQVK